MVGSGGFSYDGEEMSSVLACSQKSGLQTGKGEGGSCLETSALNGCLEIAHGDQLLTGISFNDPDIPEQSPMRLCSQLVRTRETSPIGSGGMPVTEFLTLFSYKPTWKISRASVGRLI